MIKNVLLVGFGGGLGSIARYLTQKWFIDNHPQIFPWGTFVVNIVGCLLIGIIYGISERTSLLSSPAKLFLVTGICGGFTTFSTFAFENMNLLKNGEGIYFLLYSIGSVVLGIAAVFAGVALMKLI